ncbi:hypothetical protein LP415_19260 [Polaromonas sp. P1(28)-8]|nr:hypothetical protein LP415_19260 [Polaromonas sp. P1(28)-8]
MSFEPHLIDIAEPELLFGYGQRMEHPKDGLPLYGPIRASGGGGKLRIGVVSTVAGLKRYSSGVEKLSKPIAPKLTDNPNHTFFPGFEAVFGVEWPSKPETWLQVDEEELRRAIRIEDRHQAIHKAVSLYSDAISNHLRQESESTIDLWMAVVPEEVHKYCRPQSKVGRSEREDSDILMNKKAATRLFRERGLFDDGEELRSAEIYLYELDFHNQLKARLLEDKAAVQVLRETTLAPEDFKKPMACHCADSKTRQRWLGIWPQLAFSRQAESPGNWVHRDPECVTSASSSRRTSRRPSRATRVAGLRCF